MKKKTLKVVQRYLVFITIFLSVIALQAQETIITINQPDSLKATISSSHAEVCPGDTVSISVAITGGTPPYKVTYNSTDYTSSTSPIILTLSPSATTTYSSANIQVTDSNNCQSTITGSATIIIDSTKPSITPQPDLEKCLDNNYDVVWNTGAPNNLATIPNYYTVVAGDIHATFTDNCTCTTPTIEWEILKDGTRYNNYHGTGLPTAAYLTANPIQLEESSLTSLQNIDYTVKIDVTDCNGNKSTMSYIIRVVPRPKITAP